MNQDAQQVIMTVYEAAIDPAGWPAVLDRIVELSDARGAFIFDLNPVGKRPVIQATYHTTNYDPALVTQYLAVHSEQELKDQEKFAAHSIAGDQISLVPDTVLASNRDILMSRPNARTMASYGIHHRAGALLNKDNNLSDRFAIQFSERTGQATGSNLDTILTILPHVAKSLNMGRHLARQMENRSAILSVLDHLRIGVCIISSVGDVVLRNREFDRQVEEHRAFRIDQYGKLLPRNDVVCGQLAALCGDISGHGNFGARPRKEAIFHPFDHEGFGLCIEVTPLSGQSLLGDRGFDGYALFSLDSSQPQSIDTDFLAKAFGLTQSEEDVLTMIAEGLTNAQISERRERSPETINTQIKNVLSKTMSHNRTHLLRLATEFSPGMIMNKYITNSGDGGSPAGE